MPLYNPYLSAQSPYAQQDSGGSAPWPLSLLQWIGESISKPADAVRGVLSGKPGRLANLIPFSESLGITDFKDRVSGRDMLRSWGMIGNENNAGNALGGMLAEVLTDPTMFAAGLGGMGKMSSLVGKAAGLGKTAEVAAPVLAAAGKAAPIAEAAAAVSPIAKGAMTLEDVIMTMGDKAQASARELIPMLAKNGYTEKEIYDRILSTANIGNGLNSAARTAAPIAEAVAPVTSRMAAESLVGANPTIAEAMSGFGNRVSQGASYLPEGVRNLPGRMAGGIDAGMEKVGLPRLMTQAPPRFGQAAVQGGADPAVQAMMARGLPPLPNPAQPALIPQGMGHVSSMMENAPWWTGVPLARGTASAIGGMPAGAMIPGLSLGADFYDQGQEAQPGPSQEDIAMMMQMMQPKRRRPQMAAPY